MPSGKFTCLEAIPKLLQIRSERFGCRSKKDQLGAEKRWATARKESKSAATAAPAKRTMSASARRKIAAAQKLRWAKLNAKQKKG